MRKTLKQQQGCNDSRVQPQREAMEHRCGIVGGGARVTDLGNPVVDQTIQPGFLTYQIDNSELGSHLAWRKTTCPGKTGNQGRLDLDTADLETA